MAEKKPRKKTVRVTDGDRAKIWVLRTEHKLSYRAIGRELGVGHKVVQHHYYNMLGVPSPTEILHMRAEETERIESVTRRVETELRDIVAPPQPDWATYANNAMARAKAYEAWLKETNDTFDKKLRGYTFLLKCSKQLATLNGLEAPRRVDLEVKTQTELDVEIGKLLSEMTAADLKALQAEFPVS